MHLKNVTSVAPYDAAKPQMLKFKAGHKEYEFNCESQHERTLLALGLRAAAARLANSSMVLAASHLTHVAAASAHRCVRTQVGKGGLLRLAVPSKPLGFLNAALTERNVAFPEPFRSRILPESKELVESEPSEGRRMSAGLHK